MKKLTSTMIPFAVFVLLMACNNVSDDTPPPSAKSSLSKAELVKHGKYISQIGGCNDCHSPKVMTPQGPVPDTTRLFSGHPANEPLPPIATDGSWVLFNHGTTAFVGPWGVSFGANLTPHDTGIGNWTFDQFKTALRKGKYKGLENSRSLLPPMPWTAYRHMNDHDMEALFSYLKSLPPINNAVPAPIPPHSDEASTNRR